MPLSNNIYQGPALKYRSITCQSALELINCLTPTNPNWKGRKYIFRGQSNFNFNLTPSACRPENHYLSREEQSATSPRSANDQIYFETTLLKKFLEGCDSSGLVVPGYTNQLKHELYENLGRYIGRPDDWPSSIFHEVLAAAQHHGISTRLLDWSTRSFVAAYFAASSRAYSEVGNDYLAVWALDISDRRNWQNVSIIDPPGGTSRNLAAQSGLFTAQRVRMNTSGELLNTPLEEEDEIYQNTITKELDKDKLIRFTLPFQEAPTLIELCAEFGVSGTTLFPGYEGVARTVTDWMKGMRGIEYEICEDDMNPYD